ncbi:MAG: putative porin [Verrucomicrobia bacterium]|nr:putative porin [Verrucomicrobiota bacterium]MDA1087697.1 putative porin [Verrucomicrobiota bacterium]
MKAMLVTLTAAMLLPAGLNAADVDLGGDIRLRHETIDQDGKDTRHRWRVRARVTASADVTEAVSAHLRLASGSDDPTSSNQTFGDGSSTKDFNLDRAYLKYEPQDSSLAIIGGKHGVPFNTAGDLIWDGDLNLEGLTATYGMHAFAVNLGAYWAEERSSTSDTLLFGAQVTADSDMGLSGSIGYYLWDNMKGFAPLFDVANARGNTVVEAEDGSLTYAEDFGVLNANIEFDTAVGDMPLTVFGEYVTNTDADGDKDAGFMLGIKVGKATDPGMWQASLDYRDLEADATVGLFADSDSFGGGTDGQGFRVKAKYILAKNLSAGAAVYLQQIDPDGADLDHQRLQLDLVAKF